MYLVKKIIEKCEYHSASDWKEGASGNRSMDITDSDYNKCPRSVLMEEVKSLMSKSLITVKKGHWAVYDSDPGKITFRLENLDKFYEIEEAEARAQGKIFVPKRDVVRSCCEMLEAELKRGVKKAWIAQYYTALLEKLDHIGSGKIPKDFEHMDLYLPCFRGLDELEEPMFKRIFSKKYLKNSKRFEQKTEGCVEGHVISVAKLYHGEVEADMDDTAVLSQLFIKEYSQEMALKGPLRLRILSGSKSCQVDLSAFAFGTMLNSETLQHVEIDTEQPGLRRIVTVENKANFVSMPYEEDTLYVFSHGYFSPYEREFLKKLRQILQLQEEHDPADTSVNGCGSEKKSVEYFHTGDLDYGGVKIFEYIKKRIFPELKPMQMDVETFTKYQEYAEPIPAEKLDKLKKTSIPVLQELIDRMIESGLGIEQESFLIP